MTNTPKAGELPPLSFPALCRAPHVLIGGTTGSGKSVLVNGIITAAMRCENARAYLIDPKRIELGAYRRARFCRAYGRTPADVVRLLSCVNSTMDAIYSYMERRRLKNCPFAPLYVIIDELADLMISDQRKRILPLLQRLLQLGRAANIHVIAATQAPSRRVIPAELVLNFTHRVALRCLSSIESRQIINAPGAETLPQYGRALILTPEGLTLRAVPNCTAVDVRKALEIAPLRLWRAGVRPRK